MRSKLKSKIPWDNFCMQKFGKSIAEALFLIGCEEGTRVLVYKTMKALEEKSKVMNRPAWASTKIGKC